MNKLKLGKKKILGFVTAGAIVVTMAGSYAVWDQLNATVQGPLTIDQSVKLTADAALTYSPGERNWSADAPVYESEPVTFVADVPDDTDAEVSVVATVYDKASGDDRKSLGDNYTTEIKDTSGNVVDKTTKKAQFVVYVTPKDNTVAGNTVYVELEGTLSKVTTP